MKECHKRCTNHLLFTVSNKHRKLLLLQMRSYTLTGVNYQSLIWRDPCNKIKRRKPPPFNATSVILWHPATSAPPSYLRRAALVKGPSCLPQEMQHLVEVLWLLQLCTWLFNRIRILDDLGAESVTCESSSLACISGFKFSNLYIILKTYCRMFDPHYKSPAPAAVLFLASVVRWQLLGLDPPQASAAGRSGFLQALNTWYHDPAFPTSKFNLVFVECRSLTWYLQKCDVWPTNAMFHPFTHFLSLQFYRMQTLHISARVFDFQNSSVRKQKLFGKVASSFQLWPTSRVNIVFHG